MQIYNDLQIHFNTPILTAQIYLLILTNQHESRIFATGFLQLKEHVESKNIANGGLALTVMRLTINSYGKIYSLWRIMP